MMDNNIVFEPGMPLGNIGSSNPGTTELDNEYSFVNQKRGLAQELTNQEIERLDAENMLLNDAITKDMASGPIFSNQVSAAQGADIKTSGMFNKYTGLRGNKAYRNNNPGNITGMGGNLLYGAAGVASSKHGDAGDRAQLVFNSPEEGWKAMHSLMSSKSYNNAPISKAFSKWQSDQKAWGNMKATLRKSGIDVDKQTFNSLSPSQKKTFMNQRARHEGFTGNLINDSFFAPKQKGLASAY